MSDEKRATAVLGKVTIGGDEITITRFRGHKAILAGALVARVMRQSPQITKKVTEFRKQFREENSIRITRPMAKTPRFEQLGLTPEDFGDKDVIELPMDPDGQDVFMFIFPDVYELAEKELLIFLALITIPDSELEMADSADMIDEVLTRKGKELLNKGYIEEILELCVVGWEVLQDQIMKKRDRLGKLEGVPLLGTLLFMPSQSPSSDENETPPTSTDESPISSTDSPDSTDGADEKSSTESPGESSSSSNILTPTT